MNPIDPRALTEVGQFRFSTEASDLDLRPGEWPATMPVQRSLGNGQPFRRMDAEFRAGELIAVHYRQVAGVIRLVVFND